MKQGKEEGKWKAVYICGECGGRWVRYWRERGEGKEYLRRREVCIVGKHVVEGGLDRVVKVKIKRV